MLFKVYFKEFFSHFFIEMNFSGIDVMPFMQKWTGGNEQIDKMLKTSTDFVIAYSIHKLLAPVRISISLTVTPIIVKHLRRIGLLKMPKVKPSS